MADYPVRHRLHSQNTVGKEVEHDYGKIHMVEV
jgi:hypothetical protein